MPTKDLKVTSFPDDLRKKLKNSADENERSLSAEIIYRLKLSFRDVFVPSPPSVEPKVEEDENIPSIYRKQKS
jgi:hypothetical protein